MTILNGSRVAARHLEGGLASPRNPLIAAAARQPPFAAPKGPASGRWLRPSIALAVLVGTMLRIAGARGDLWLDEIWSYRLLDIQSSVSGILFALPHSNNHLLNTLWLSFVGAHVPPLVARLPAIALGALSIVAAARLGARRDRVFAIAAAAVFAASYLFVHYGSEARGYAGLILAVLLALHALDATLETGPTARNLIELALAIAFGTLSHLMMVEATAVLCATAAIRLSLTDGLTPRALTRLRPILIAAAAGTLPPLACFGYGVMTRGLWTGEVHPYALGALRYGLARALGALVGLPDTPATLGASGLTIGVAAICALAALAVLPRERRVFPLLAIFALPATAAMVHVPNANFARFHLVTAVAMALLGAEIFAQAWHAGHALRRVAITAAAALLIATSVDVARFLILERGHYAAAVAFMTRQGAARYVTAPASLSGVTDAVIRWYDDAGRLARSDGAGESCEGPDWLVLAEDPNEASEAPDVRWIGAASCARPFARRAVFPAYGLSGFIWTVYGRQEGS